MVAACFSGMEVQQIELVRRLMARGNSLASGIHRERPKPPRAAQIRSRDTEQAKTAEVQLLILWGEI